MVEYQAVSKKFNAASLKSNKDAPVISDSPIGKTFATTHLASCYFAMGNCYKNLGQFENALRYLHASLLITEKASCSLKREKIEDRIIETEIQRPDAPYPFESEKYWINVPQGRTCRLIRRVDNMEYAGLYSDRFVSCSIVIIQSNSRLSMTHLDHMTDGDLSHLTHLADECTWVSKVDGACHITVVYRPGGEFIVDPLKDFIHFVNEKKDHALFRSLQLELIKVSDEINGVKSSFAQGVETCQSTIRPFNLLTHPNDFQITVCRQIEQVLYLSNKKSPPICRVIFDGRCWVWLSEKELQPPALTAASKELMASIRPTDKNVRVWFAVIDFLSKSQDAIMVHAPADLAYSASRFLRLYANKYNAHEVFRLDVLHALILYYEEDDFTVLTAEEVALVQNLNTVLKKPDFTVYEALEFVKPFGEGQGTFQKEFVQAFRKFMRRFYEGKCELNRAFSIAQALEKVDSLNQYAQKEFLNKNYVAALRFYSDPFVLLAHSVTRDNQMLIQCVEKMANCRIQLEQCPEALELLLMAKTYLLLQDGDFSASHQRLDEKINRCKTILSAEVPDLNKYEAKEFSGKGRHRK